MKRSWVKWILVSAALGLLAPACWFGAQAIWSGSRRAEWKILYPLERLIRVIWPSSIWLMAPDSIEGTHAAYFFILLSVAANVLLYALVGGTLWRLKQFLNELFR